MPCGSTLVSSTATTGMPSTLASLIASSSLLASITNITSGTPPMSRIPPSESSSLSRSRVSWSTSFLVRPAVSPESCSSSALRRLIDCEMVLQLVSIPPSQRWLTKCWPHAFAASAIGCCAWRLVPTNNTLPPACTVAETNSSARANSGTVCDRSMMWTELRAPKMYGFIRGFQRWVWWPKCAPASINCCMVTTGAAIVVSFPVMPLGSWNRAEASAAAPVCQCFPCEFAVQQDSLVEAYRRQSGPLALFSSEFHPRCSEEFARAVAAARRAGAVSFWKARKKT